MQYSNNALYVPMVLELGVLNVEILWRCRDAHSGCSESYSMNSNDSYSTNSNNSYSTDSNNSYSINS